MNKNRIISLFVMFLVLSLFACAKGSQTEEPRTIGCVHETGYHKDISNLLLKDYRPKSAYNIQKSTITKAKYTAIDMHSHPYPSSEEEVAKWVETMDASGIEKTIVLTMATGAKFDSLVQVYSKFQGRFDLWCGFDYTGYQESGWSDKAVAELERCSAMGARGVGELGDKGEGLLYSTPTQAYGLHINDARMKPLIEKCGELNMPINIHVAEPYWMYLPMEKDNDGLMNAYTWRIEKSKEDMLMHDELVSSLERAVRDNPNTTFIACHYANCSYDLSILGDMLDQYPNLYADISARYAEIGPIPRAAKAFIEKYSDRLLYGTDMGTNKEMYNITFRMLESSDEHFYEIEQFNYHWALNGLDLSDQTLKKLYYENAKSIIK